MTKQIDPVTLYRESSNLLDSVIEDLSELDVLEKQLYDAMITGVKLSDIVKINPNATLPDAMKLAYKNIKSIYEKWKKKVESIEDPDAKPLAERYLSGIRPIVKAYELALLSILQNTILLTMIPYQKTLEEYQKELKEYKSEVKYWKD